jgi:molybdate transport system substrate-binding protein
VLSRAAAIALSLAAPAAAEEITVFAASSLTNAMTEVEAGFEAATGHDVTVAYAGSSALARQIRQGAPADVFISANADWMDALEADGLLAPGTRVDLLSNALVLIAADAEADPVEIGPDMDLPALLGTGRLAMALVEAVPAGLYGKAALTSLGQWDAVAPKVAQAGNVRAALALVALGEAPFGIVYATDSKAEEAVSVVGTFPADSHPPITYPAAALGRSDTALTVEFLAYLRGAEARAIFEAEGFTMLVSPDG